MPSILPPLPGAVPSCAAASRAVLRLGALLALAACIPASAPEPAPTAAPVPAPRVAPAAPPATSRHFVHLPSADSLGGYLRAGSGAGVLVSAHRGGPADGHPENAIETFERSVRLGPVLLEADVQLTRDSMLVLLHDDSLQRTTTGVGPLAARRFREVRSVLLQDDDGDTTAFRIPSLAEALAWSEGRAILMLDIKRGVPPVRVVDAIRRAHAENRAVVIVYTLEDLLRYHALAPDLNISVSVSTPADLDRLVATGVNPRRLIAFVGVGEADPTVLRRLRALGIRSQMGTFGAIDRRAREEGAAVYLPYLRRGVDVLATDEPALALEAARSLRRGQTGVR